MKNNYLGCWTISLKLIGKLISRLESQVFIIFMLEKGEIGDRLYTGWGARNLCSIFFNCPCKLSNMVKLFVKKTLSENLKGTESRKNIPNHGKMHLNGIIN